MRFRPGREAALLIVYALGGACLFTACAPGRRADASGPGRPRMPPMDTIAFQFIYVIHGDAGYTYYDEAGSRHRADMEAVAQAREVGRGSKNAETFIFHQRPRRWLSLFRGRDGSMEVYREGGLTHRQGYARGSGSGLDAEAALARAYARPASHRIFLYFGHEIPATASIPYSRSRPHAPFTVDTFAASLGRFPSRPTQTGRKPFDALVLSACHGGNPRTIQALAPYASVILASPGELHLTYLDSRALIPLTREAASADPRFSAPAWSAAMASASFARLCANTSTPVTVALYQSEKAAAYLRTHLQGWQPGLQNASSEASAAAGHHDCAENPGFGMGGPEAGATLLYRAPLFGADRDRAFTSGWECPGYSRPWLSRADIDPVR